MVASTGVRDTGAVASSRAAEIYGLQILSDKIQVKTILQICYFFWILDFGFSMVKTNHIYVCIHHCVKNLV